MKNKCTLVTPNKMLSKFILLFLPEFSSASITWQGVHFNDISKIFHMISWMGRLLELKRAVLFQYFWFGIKFCMIPMETSLIGIIWTLKSLAQLTTMLHAVAQSLLTRNWHNLFSSVLVIVVEYITITMITIFPIFFQKWFSNEPQYLIVEAFILFGDSGG